MEDSVWSCRAGLESVVEAILDEFEINAPPVDAIGLAERMRLEVRLCRDQSARGRIVDGRQRTICVRPEPREERHQWTVAHEIGESLMPRLVDACGMGAEESLDREWLANRFAGALLVPLVWFGPDYRRLDGCLLDLKKLYRTASCEVIAQRMLDLKHQAAVSIFDHNTLTRRTWNADGFDRRHPMERIAQSQCHFQGKVVTLTDAEGVQVRAWPVHEGDWKREIVVLVMQESW
jgi:hypothetical protein